MSCAKAAARYIERGWAPVPIPARQKGPQIPGWNRLRSSASDVPRYFTNRQNIGIINGGGIGRLPRPPQRPQRHDRPPKWEAPGASQGGPKDDNSALAFVAGTAALGFVLAAGTYVWWLW